MAGWRFFRVAHSLRINLDRLVVRALKTANLPAAKAKLFTGQDTRRLSKNAMMENLDRSETRARAMVTYKIMIDKLLFARLPCDALTFYFISYRWHHRLPLFRSKPLRLTGLGFSTGKQVWLTAAAPVNGAKICS